jgi:hypothetical protein
MWLESLEYSAETEKLFLNAYCGVSCAAAMAAHGSASRNRAARHNLDRLKVIPLGRATDRTVAPKLKFDMGFAINVE